MFRSNRNNPFFLILAGILAIPVISAVTGMVNNHGKNNFIKRFKDEGIHMFTPGRFRVNGRDTIMNPFSIRSLDNIVSKE